jgi:hypothetical protein
MRPLNVLFLVSAHNSLSQRSWIREDRSYHEARHRFVHKLGAPCAVPTPAVETRPATIRRARAR